jgi:hypothetical protein
MFTVQFKKGNMLLPLKAFTADLPPPRLGKAPLRRDDGQVDTPAEKLSAAVW